VIEDWKRTLSVRATEWGLPAAGEWNFLFHNNYQPKNSTINLLWFHENERFPRVVTKMCRDKSILAWEFRNLQTVHHLAPRYVPRPLHLGSADGFFMLWMEGVPGRRIPPGGKYPISMLAASVETVISLHRAVNQGMEESAGDRHARMVTAPLGAVLKRGGPAVREGCLALLETATAQWLQRLPVIPQHGDLYLDNVLHYREEYRIVDWENFGVIDLPFYDLLTLLISFLRPFPSAPERWGRSLRKEISPLIDRYGGELMVPPSTVSLLLPLTMANWFYLHWIEGRAAAEVMYADLEHYFAHPASWEEVFLRR
jgi:hypothetical protein